MQEKLIKWEPIKNLQQRYWVEDMILEEKNLTIELYPEQEKLHKVVLYFNGTVHAYRYTNESFCFNLYDNFFEESGQVLQEGWVFFKVKNSKYLETFLDIKKISNLIHFSILGYDEIVDVIAAEEPVVIFKRITHY